MSTVIPETLKADVLALLPRDPVAENVRALLAEEGFRVVVRRPDEEDSWTGADGVGALLVDETVSPETLDEAIRVGRITATAPVFVLAKRLPDRERYLAWLEAGAWDIMKMPLEAVALTLRLRSILGIGSTLHGPAAARTYSWESLGQAAEEALALSRRYERPLHCIAVSVRPENRSQADPNALIRRIAGAVHRLTRRSDLIGIADIETVVVLLPDTNAVGAEVFQERLEEAIGDRLRSWDVRAELRAVRVSSETVETAHELLDRAAISLRPAGT